MPGAMITLTNTATTGVRSTVSTSSGDYTFASVPIGTYELKVEHLAVCSFEAGPQLFTVRSVETTAPLGAVVARDLPGTVAGGADITINQFQPIAPMV